MQSMFISTSKFICSISEWYPIIMTRHARNCTAGAVYSYHEKKKDTKTSGYGSQSMRLGKDSVKVSLI